MTLEAVSAPITKWLDRTGGPVDVSNLVRLFVPHDVEATTTRAGV